MHLSRHLVLVCWFASFGVNGAPIYPFAGKTGYLSGYDGDGGPATNATFSGPRSMTVDRAGNVFIVDQDSVIRRVDAATGIITTYAGNGGFGEFSGDRGPATNASLFLPHGLAADTNGNLYIADTFNMRIRKVDSITGIITTVAGGNEDALLNDGHVATDAWLAGPQGLAFDASGNMYIADTGHRRLRKVDATTQIITTIAGWDAPPGPDGDPTSGGDGGPAKDAYFYDLTKVAIDSDGNIFVVDRTHDEQNNDIERNRVRRIDAATAIITRYSGGGTNRTWTGSAVEADFGDIRDIAVFRNRLYILGKVQAWKVDLTTGQVRLFAGTGAVGDSGDGGPATQATFGGPGPGDPIEGLQGLAVAANGDAFIADGAIVNRVRRVQACVDDGNCTAERFSIRSVVAGGGGVASGNGLFILDTMGQPDASGPLTNAQFSLVGGFWALPIAVQTPGAPVLTIVRAALPGSAMISWTPAVPGFRLQVSDTLSPPAWTDAPSGANNPVTVPTMLPAKFYRLTKP